MTELYDWGDARANGLPGNPDPVTNEKLLQDQDHFTERLDSEAAVSAEFRQNTDETTGLTFAYYGGTAGVDNAPVEVAAGTKTLTASSINYIEMVQSTGVISVNTSGFTSGKRPLFRVTTDTGSVTAVVDYRGMGAVSSASGVSSVTASEGLASSGGANPEITIEDDGVTDAKIGDRTVDQALATPGNTGTLTSLLSWIVGRIKAITGETNWYDAPDTTLAATATHIAASAPHAGHLKADGTVAMTADMDAGGFKITNLDTPTDAGDAVTKAYADGLASGFLTKLAVEAATTGNIALTGEQTIDAVAIVAGDRVLVKNQTTTSQNGIYIASAGAWARSTDADTSGELAVGTAVTAEYGAANAGSKFVVVTAPTTLDTDPVIWTLDSAGGGGAGSTITNLGTGANVWKELSGTVNYLRSILAGSSKLAVTQNTNDITLDVDPGEIDINDLDGTLDVDKGGSGVTAATMGGLVYGSGTDTRAELAGNTTTTIKFLTQTGDGANSAAPAWNPLIAAYVPLLDASKINSGVFATGRLGSGTANSSTWLRGDNTWQTLPVAAGAVPRITGLGVLWRSDATIPDPGGAIGSFDGSRKVIDVGLEGRSASFNCDFDDVLDANGNLDIVKAQRLIDENGNIIVGLYLNPDGTIQKRVGGTEDDTDGTWENLATEDYAVPKSLVNAKGDLLVATANDTIARLPVGTNDYVLTADSTATEGVAWKVAAGGGGGGGEYTVAELASEDVEARVGQTVWVTDGAVGEPTAAISDGTIWRPFATSSTAVTATPLMTNLALWVAARRLSLSSDDPVSAFTDYSGNSFTPTSSGSNQPTFKTNIIGGKPALYFTTDDYLTYDGALISSGDAPVTVFVVCRVSNFSNYPELLEIGQTSRPSEDTSGYQFAAGSGGIMYCANFGGNSDRSTGGILSTSTDYILTFRVEGGAWSSGNPDFWMNGTVQSSSGGSGTGTPNIDPERFRIGANLSGTPDQFLEGYIAEMLVYNAALTDGEVDDQNELLNAIYSIY